MMIIMVLEKTPAELRPAMALPTIKAGEFGAAPQTTDPTSNNAMAVRKTHFSE